ncbi:hypothetical protein [Bosea sp. TND4EK4]|uniref:hypothetical protein n=1 Tax=Bosea sp. TND4EK4 TaxID=1907408 RepID=UPI000970455B|nr:hypothetical protein [Bosea sp. TND4EK4]
MPFGHLTRFDKTVRSAPVMHDATRNGLRSGVPKQRGSTLDFPAAHPHNAAMAPRTRRSPKPDRIVRDEEVEILPPRTTLPLDWSVIVPTVAAGMVIGFAASLVVGAAA